MTFQDIHSKINTATALDFGTIFNNCIELFKKVWVQGLVILILAIVLAIPLALVIYIPMIILGVSAEVSGGGFDSEVFAPIIGLAFLLVILMMLVVVITVGIGLRAAFCRIAKHKDLNEMGRDDYFFFLRRPYLKKTIIVSLAYLGILTAGVMLCYLPVFYAIVPLSLMVPIYAFNPDLTVSEIVKLSFNLGAKKWLITFGLMFVIGFLSTFVGFLLCGIGVYFLSSINYLVPYFVYKDVVGFGTTTTDNQQTEIIGIEFKKKID